MDDSKAKGSEVASEPSIVGREVISGPGAAVELMKLKLSPGSKDALKVGRVALGAVTASEFVPDGETRR
jgi:hypothetical protein